MKGREEAAAAIWRWREVEDVARARRARLRRSGLVRALIASAIGALLLWLERTIVGSVALGIGSITLVLALASPDGAYAALDRFVDRIGALVGALVAWLLLAPLFFLFFVPFRWLFRRGARDRMARHLERERASYWIRRTGKDDPARLERLY